MLRLLKNNTFRLVFAGLAIILTAMITILPGAFALGYRISVNPDPSIEPYAEDTTIYGSEIVSVNHAGDYSSIYGNIYLTDDSTDNCAQYSTFSITRGSAVPASAEVNINHNTGEFSINGDPAMSLSAGDEIIKTNIEIAPEAPNGTFCEIRYNIGYLAETDEGTEDWPTYDSGGIYYQYMVDRNITNIHFYNAGPINKTYGDDNFSNLIPSGITHGATVSYASGDESVATVDSATGEVHIVGAGSTTITATSAPYYSYTEGTASYTLNVAPKEISITDAIVPDKTYDGTTVSEVGTVTLSEAGLVQGTDYTVSAVLDDANVGSDRTATVTVTLVGDAANNYILASNTFDVDDVTVSPYAITADDVALEYYVTRVDGSVKEPGVTVKIGNFTVDPNEYTVEYEDNIDVGTATVTVTAKDNMNIASSAQKNFEIVNKSVLEITGISSPQTKIYTGSPVALDGTLTVGDNNDGITVDDITIIWYIYINGGWVVTTQPTDVGIYRVRYIYDGTNYAGSLEANFEITQATSPEPVEMGGFEIEAGKRLSEITGTRTRGFRWDDENIIVERGRNTYLATYVYNDDPVNYTTLHLRISVEGLYDPEPTPVPDAGGDEESIVVPDTGRFTSTKTGASNVTFSIGIAIISGIALFTISTMILDKKLARNKINFDKK